MSTAFPSGLLLASTFDPAAAYAGGRVIGAEAHAKGLNVMLAGGTNLARDPRNGRNFEYLGEDPLLAGTLSGESVRGIQSMGVVSTVKHFALNGQEHNRMTADSVLNDAAARESDLLAFEIAIERGAPGSVMCAYNLWNGVYACENDHLLNDILKKDWHYPGWVMSDWGAVHGLHALTAGLDQQSGQQLDKQVWFDAPLKEAVAAANPNTIVVLETGNPVRMPWADKVGAVIEAWYSGGRGGEAIARVLFGEVNPSGRLPISWPVDESELPRPVIPGTGAKADAPVTVDYNIEGSDVGYRWYARQGTKPRYPFGYGLSYTSFRYANLKLTGGRTITASFDVTNTGAKAGKDVPQVYLTSAAGKTVRRLIGFQKVALAPGETSHLSVTADPRLLGWFDEGKHGWQINAGRYTVALGSDAQSESAQASVSLAASRLRP
jgi:hypothetical protein